MCRKRRINAYTFNAYTCNAYTFNAYTCNAYTFNAYTCNSRRLCSRRFV
jgi:hypothetical protein